MKTHYILLALLCCVTANASIENPKAHVMKMARAQSDSNHEELYNLFEQATGEEHFSETLKLSGGEKEFRSILKRHFTPYEVDSLWVASSVEEVVSFRPDQKDLLSPYKSVKPGFLIVYVGDKKEMSYFFFKKEKANWRMVTPEEYAPLPHG